MKKNGKDSRPGLSPIRKIEVSEEQKGLRIALAAVFLAIGAVAIIIGLVSLLNTEPGWQEVEINANGYRDGRAYPDRRVWELSRQYRLTWLINSDAHEVAHLCDEAGVGGTEAFARELGIPVTEWFDW